MEVPTKNDFFTYTYIGILEKIKQMYHVQYPQDPWDWYSLPTISIHLP